MGWTRNVSYGNRFNEWKGERDPLPGWLLREILEREERIKELRRQIETLRVMTNQVPLREVLPKGEWESERWLDQAKQARKERRRAKRQSAT